jgi:hypothetical protein
MIRWALTDRVHRVRREFKHAIKNERATLEEAITPIPAIVLNDVVRLRFDPEIECDEDDTADPSVKDRQSGGSIGIKMVAEWRDAP